MGVKFADSDAGGLLGVCAAGGFGGFAHFFRFAFCGFAARFGGGAGVFLVV